MKRDCRIARERNQQANDCPLAKFIDWSVVQSVTFLLSLSSFWGAGRWPREAYDGLNLIVDQFPKEWLMRFNLPCYACQLDQLPDAMRWLEKAISVAGDNDIRPLALDDADLKPLWNQIGDS